MNNFIRKLPWFCFFGFIALNAQLTLAATSSDFAATPPNLGDSSDPFVMINLSVELTQQAEAYTDGAQTLVGGAVCPGHINSRGVCYFNTETYLGYFDSGKCYVYDETGTDNTLTQLVSGAQNASNPDHFKPNSLANADFTCNGGTEFSGNFMNWATMTALDEFRMVMTGGARIVDTSGATAKTLLTRTHRYGDWGFREKQISGASSGTDLLSRDGVSFVNSPSQLTPYGFTGLRIKNNPGHSNGNRVSFYDHNDNFQFEYNVIVEVCNPAVGLESNCVAYSDGTNTWYKPEGQIQQHALNMRFALMSYTGQDGNTINGGVLRSNAKYVGVNRPAAAGGLETNPNAEIDSGGVFTFNPDGATIGSGVNNSGIMNYINSFGLGSEQYKSNDPVSELYYEGLRYFMNVGPTLSYSAGISDSEKDNFPILTTWTDPIANECQANFMVSIGDQFSHEDSQVPGVAVSVVDGIDAKTTTDAVGLLEGGGGGAWPTGLAGVYTSLGSQTGARYSRNDGYWIAGLAYWAHTNDIRPEAALPGMQTIKTFTVDTQEYNSNPPSGAANQFWLAAKYGGFNDANGDDDPNDGTPGANTTEWDEDGDGVPDAYTLSSQPARLQAGLSAAFNEIAEKVNAGSAAAVVANVSSGAGAVYQALYKPKQTDDDGRQVQWVGIVRALLIDEHGNFREDTDRDNVITNADYVVTLEYDETLEKSVVERFVTADGGETFVASGLAATDVDDLIPLWEANDQLAAISDVRTQRPYTSSAANGRHVLTSIDSNLDGKVVGSELVDFDESVFQNASDASGANANYFRWLGLDSSTGDEAENIVNFIRGEEISGYRSRTIDIGDDGSVNVWRLGDIVHSSPVAVGRPDSRYDSRYRDDTYAAFKDHYKDRRQMIYTGSNDGMLHAFNGGFFDQTSSEFSVTGPGTETEHPLGSEMWAYVPNNLLPHLRWLAEPGYPHVFYVDGIPQVYDVNIFSDDADHPHGWGTILVVGMRMGGGDITFDPNNDLDGDASDDVTTRSAFVVLDVTNPEKPPALLAELTNEDLGFTTMRPTVIKRRVAQASGTFEDAPSNQWYLMFGSGPAGDTAATKQQALEAGISNQSARVFFYDLNTLTFVEPDTASPGVISLPVTGSSLGQVGDMASEDWDNDYTDDVVYFGTIEDSVAAPDGLLKRFVPGTNLSITSATFSDLLVQTGGLDQPFMGAPLPYTDVQGRPWVFVGSGRLIVADDNLVSTQQSYYGLKEPLDASGDFTWASVDRAGLVDTSGLRVFLDGTLTASNGVLADVTLNTSDVVNSFAGLQSVIDDNAGWFLDFDDTASRQLGHSAISAVSVIFSEYTPEGDVCDSSGISLLNAVHYSTGTAAPFGALGPGTDYVRNSDNLESLRSVKFGQGLIRDVIMAGDRVIGQDETGGLSNTTIIGPTAPSGRISWREIPLE